MKRQAAHLDIIEVTRSCGWNNTFYQLKDIKIKVWVPPIEWCIIWQQRIIHVFVLYFLYILFLQRKKHWIKELFDYIEFWFFSFEGAYLSTFIESNLMLNTIGYPIWFLLCLLTLTRLQCIKERVGNSLYYLGGLHFHAHKLNITFRTWAGQKPVEFTLVSNML